MGREATFWVSDPGKILILVQKILILKKIHAKPKVGSKYKIFSRKRASGKLQICMYVFGRFTFG